MTDDPVTVQRLRAENKKLFEAVQRYWEELCLLHRELTTLDSERMANAILTDELELARAEIQRLRRELDALQGLPSLPTEN